MGVSLFGKLKVLSGWGFWGFLCFPVQVINW